MHREYVCSAHQPKRDPGRHDNNDQGHVHLQKYKGACAEHLGIETATVKHLIKIGHHPHHDHRQ